jgi:hypothetical protein
MKYQVKITSIQTHTLDVLAENRYEALKKAKETLEHADPSEYRTELESIAHITMLEVGSGYEWMIRETPSSIAWRRFETEHENVAVCRTVCRKCFEQEMQWRYLGRIKQQ